MGDTLYLFTLRQVELLPRTGPTEGLILGPPQPMVRQEMYLANAQSKGELGRAADVLRPCIEARDERKAVLLR